MKHKENVISRYENNVDFIPEYVEGKFDIPFIKPEKYVETTFVPFNMAGSIYKREEVGIHFFIHDFQFQRLWTMREKYKAMLPEFRAVMTPDFSLFTDWPKMVQMWNHYRKHLLGAWMQELGCLVYPTIRWSDESSYEWCFDGEPMGGTVCVGSVGTQGSKETRRLFLSGYEKMMEVLKPETILFYGKIPSECTGNIIPLDTFTSRFKEMRE